MKNATVNVFSPFKVYGNHNKKHKIMNGYILQFQKLFMISSYFIRSILVNTFKVLMLISELFKDYLAIF